MKPENFGKNLKRLRLILDQSNNNRSNFKIGDVVQLKSDMTASIQCGRVVNFSKGKVMVRFENESFCYYYRPEELRLVDRSEEN